jgi:hypothetical protein
MDLRHLVKLVSTSGIFFKRNCGSVYIELIKCLNIVKLISPNSIKQELKGPQIIF